MDPEYVDAPTAHDKQQQQQRNREFMRRLLDSGMTPSDSYVEWRAQKQFEIDTANAKEQPTTHEFYTQVFCMHCKQRTDACICKEVRGFDSIKKRKF